MGKKGKTRSTKNRSDVEMIQAKSSFLPKDFVHCIETNYFAAKKMGISRLDIRWGGWSASMNRLLRQKIGEESEGSTVFKYVFMLWITRSRLLELYHTKRRIFKKAEKQSLVKEAKELRGIIKEDTPFNLRESFDELAKRMLLT